MKDKPRKTNEPILNLKNVVKSIAQGFFIFLVVFITYLNLIKNNFETNLAITVTYSTLVLSIMLITYQLKNDKLTITNLIFSFKDKVSLIVNFGIITGLLLYIYLPFFNNVANTSALTIKWWCIIILLVLLAILPFDIFKLIRIKKQKNKNNNYKN